MFSRRERSSNDARRTTDFKRSISRLKSICLERACGGRSASVEARYPILRGSAPRSRAPQADRSAWGCSAARGSEVIASTRLAIQLVIWLRAWLGPWPSSAPTSRRAFGRRLGLGCPRTARSWRVRVATRVRKRLSSWPRRPISRSAPSPIHVAKPVNVEFTSCSTAVVSSCGRLRASEARTRSISDSLANRRVVGFESTGEYPPAKEHGLYEDRGPASSHYDGGPRRAEAAILPVCAQV